MIYEKFINDVATSESVKRLYETIFDNVRYLEEKYNINVKQFSNIEINELINMCVKGKTYNSTMVKVGLIRKFFYYINNNAIDDVVDNINDLISNSYEIQHNRYISKADLIKLICKLENISDRCILMLLRNGIGIKHEIEDLINLKMENINLKSKTIYGKLIDDYTMELVQQTIKEKEYITLGVYERIIIYNCNSKYLFKTRITKGTNDGLAPFKPSGFRGRLQRIKSVLNDDERVILSNLILSYVVDLVVNYEIENNITMTQIELRKFLIDTIGSCKSIYDIRTMATYIKSTIQ
jgi:hypothetical protein